MNNIALIPLDAVRSNLHALDEEDMRPRIVLLSTGALCPVHNMHIEMLELAKTFLEAEKGAVVLGGWLSPSHDNYVRTKLEKKGEKHILGFHRCNMVRAATASSTWLRCSSWEVEQSRFVDFPQVYENFQTFLDVEFPNAHLQLWYVCGADHASRTNLVSRLAINAVVVSRPGSEFRKRRQDGSLLSVDGRAEDISSTLLRKLLLRKASVEKYTPKEVVEYLSRNNVFS